MVKVIAAVQISPEQQRKFDQQALRAFALKYDLRPSQVRAMREDIRYMIRNNYKAL